MRLFRHKIKKNKKKIARTWRAYIAIGKKIFIVLTIMGACLLWRVNYHNILYQQTKVGFLQSSAKAGFRVEDILVKGRRHTQQADILSAIKIWKNQPIFACDLCKIRQDLLQIGWIKEAIVQRNLPNTLNINITERTHIAIWQHQKSFFVVDDSGGVFKIETPKTFNNLPILIGLEAPQKSPHILKILEAYPELKKQIINITLIRQRRWDLNLTGGIVVKLPEINIEEAIGQLENLRALNKIIPGEMISIDLRAMPQIFIRFNSEIIKKIMLINKGNVT